MLTLTGEAARAQSVPAAPAIGADAIAVPSLDFDEQPEMAKAHDKYFFFHRDGTTFAEALADVRECDGYARGLAYRVTANPDDPLVKNSLIGPLFEAIGARWSSTSKPDNMSI